MSRPSPVLSWTLLRCRVECTQTINQSRQRIISSAAKDLPSWAIPFSTRRVHTSTRVSKPQDDSILRSVGLEWDARSDGDASDDSFTQVVLEWKVMQNRLKGKTAELQLPAIEWGLPPQAPKPPPLPDFFVPNTTALPKTYEEKTQEAVIPKIKLKISNAALDDRIWITDLDPNLLKGASQAVMSQIRNGERNIDELAKVFLQSLEVVASGISKEATKWEQARLFVFSDWIAKAAHVFENSKLQVNAIALCINITADLYSSMQERRSKASSTEPYGLSGIWQTTLQRMFGLLYPYTRRQGRSFEAAKVSCQALTLISRLLRDNGLRPAQVRYLCRRFLVRLEYMASTTVGICDQVDLWTECATTFAKLISSGVLTSSHTVDEHHSSNTSPLVDNILRLFCLALARGHITHTWAKTAILDLARGSQVALMQKMALASKDGSLNVEPFVSQSTLEEMIKILSWAGRYELARDIAFMAPKEQRNVQILSLLMYRWSGVLPDLTAEDVKRRDQSSRVRRGTFRVCGISQQIWLEAVSLLDVSNKADLSAFIAIFNARMLYHARSKAPRLISADLDALQRLHGGGLSTSDLLGLLNHQAQKAIVRAHVRAIALNQAREWAHKILQASKDRRNTTNAAKEDWLSLQIMNVLLSASLDIKGNGKILTARHRYSMVLRQGGAIKKGRSYLRGTVNRYLQTKKEELLPRSKTSKGLNMFRYRQATDYLLAFATRHGIIPDEKTTTILLASLLQLRSKDISSDILLRIKEQADFDWKTKGVSGVLDEMKTLLEGGQVVPKEHPLSSEKGAKRAQMIDAAIQRRQWKQDYGQQRLNCKSRRPSAG